MSDIQAPAAPAASAEPAAPWAPGTYDEATAAKLIENQKADKAKLSAANDELRTKLTAFEAAEQVRAQAQMTELEKAQAQIQRMEADKAAQVKELADMRAAQTRKDILSRHGFTEADAPSHLKYVPEAELEAAVADVVKLRGPARENAAEAIPGKPAPKLTAGHETAAAAGTPNIREMAQAILNRR